MRGLLCDDVLANAWKFSKKKFHRVSATVTSTLIAMAARQRKKAAEAIEQIPEGQNVIAQFKSVDGESTGPPLNLPVNVTPDQLEMLLNQLMNTVCNSNRSSTRQLDRIFRLINFQLQSDDPQPYSFHVEEAEITKNLWTDMKSKSTEENITIVYQPQAVFKVRAVTRCSSTLSGNV